MKRVAKQLTRKDFMTAKKIGNVVEAHAQLGICTATLSMWKRLGTWPKVLAYKAEMSEKAKNKRDGVSPKETSIVKTSTVKRGRPAKIKETVDKVSKTSKIDSKVVSKKAKAVPAQAEEFPNYVYLNIVKEIVAPIKDGIEQLTKFLKENTIVVKKK